MNRRNRRRRKGKSNKIKWAVGVFLTMLLLCAILYMTAHFLLWNQGNSPEEVLISYMNCISEQKYNEMYEMIDVQNSGNISQEDFVQRNSAIYEGIEVRNMKIQITEYKEAERTVYYESSFDTIAGSVSFDNEAVFTSDKDGYKLVWHDSLIFPELSADDKVRISTTQAERGQILDRNEKVLAGKGTVSSVGIIPGKLEDRDQSIQEIANLLEITKENIEDKLSANWVKDDSFVPIKTVPKVDELNLTSLAPDTEMLQENERQQKLLDISGVMISDEEVRSYPLGEAAAHLIGYVQNVTAEDLEKHPGEGYSSNSVIGRSGAESLYETELKGKDGYKIYIVDSEGNEIATITETLKEDGKDIRLTIDSDLQKELYEQFKTDRGCSVAMNPYTGEVLALVSTPSYDNNDFILGMSDETWTALNEDENQPLYNRFRQIWCPGSTFKPVIAAIGLKTGTLDPNEDFGNEGLSWQKDSSWGSYEVTTLHEYEPVIMKNALIYSDNIYFAKAALKIGADNLMNSLNEIGFNQKTPFEITMEESQYSNTERIETEIQLADSGYGQGQILVNPLHLASIYTSFLNDGNILQPYLQYSENPAGKIWVNEAFSSETVSQVMDGLTGVVNDPNGTGYTAHRDDILLAGKTGTAELKESKEDTSGTEIGWFTVFTADKNAESPILLVSMVENVKGIGGSGYVVSKDKAVLDQYFAE
ncbi:MAG TPA: penicillin-binding transpeptidase domain-containing protein [Candidatus Mediterraneibacter guildfordensis]|nr:penicillin-binding transpeptidase domain-containing protein [Candidatus Mediterraneibacter guildfordensis]